MNELHFGAWLERQAPRLAENTATKVGKVACFPRAGDFSNIIHLDQALRLMARLDPLYDLSPELKAYAASKPWKARP